jgi:hypothetical protein
MALSNSEKQQRWRERHLARRRQVQRIAGLLLRRKWGDEHFKELGDLLQSLLSRDDVAALRRALRPRTSAEMEAINRAAEVAVRELWLREHPGRTCADYDRLPGGAKWEWRLAKSGAIVDAERAAWLADHPGREYPEHEGSLTDRESTDLGRWRRQYERRLASEVGR